MADRSSPPDIDPTIFAKIRAIAADLDRDALRIDVHDPAFISLVDRAVRPYAPFLTEHGVAEARLTATFGLIMRPDLDALLERERARLAKQSSGVQATRNATQLEEATRRAEGNGSR